MQINITDLPAERFFVKLDAEFAEKINKSVAENYSNFTRLAEVMNLWSGTMYSWRNKNAYPLSVLMEICRLCKIDIKNEQHRILELRSHVYGNGRVGYSRSNPIRPKFPIKLTPEFSSLVAHLFCDGSLSVDKNGYVHIHYYNTDRKLLEDFRNTAAKVFGITDIYESKNKGISFLSLPTPVGLILKIKIKDFSSKSCRIPEFIKNSNDISIKKAFIRAFVDDEGSVIFRPPRRYIEISCSNIELLSDLRIMIEEIGIRCGHIYHKALRGFDFYYFYVRGHGHIKRFRDEIGLIHSKKSEKLNRSIDSKQRIRYGHEESKELVLKALKSGMRRKEIAAKLNRKLNTIDYHIKVLKNKGVIERKPRKTL